MILSHFEHFQSFCRYRVGTATRSRPYSATSGPLVSLLDHFSVVLSLPCWNRLLAEASTATFFSSSAFQSFCRYRVGIDSWAQASTALFFSSSAFQSFCRYRVGIDSWPGQHSHFFFIERFSVVLSLPCWNRFLAQASTATFFFFFFFFKNRPLFSRFVVTVLE